MALVSLVGIKVFATGGIGGVHRGGEVSLDISSDLTELARSRMLVVCAGIKSILDVPRTLEVLETYGVTVAAFNTPNIPAFYSRSSGVPAAVVVHDAVGAAQLLLAQEALGMHSSILITVPPPHDDAADAAAIEDAITVALSDARAQSIKGPQETPFLLQRVSEITGSKSLAANIALYLNNASVAADIACAHVAEAAIRCALPSRQSSSAPSLSCTQAALSTYSKVTISRCIDHAQVLPFVIRFLTHLRLFAVRQVVHQRCPRERAATSILVQLRPLPHRPAPLLKRSTYLWLVLLSSTVLDLPKETLMRPYPTRARALFGGWLAELVAMYAKLSLV